MQQTEVYVARQPIFDRNRRVLAYELLFRNSRENFARVVDDRTATGHVISAGYLDFGIRELTAGMPAFINFSRDLLVDGTPKMLPSEQVVIEILEDVVPDSEVIAAVRDLKQRGYRVALDDFNGGPEFDELVPLADLIKIEFGVGSASDLQARVERARSLHRENLTLIAEKVETNEQLAEARGLGFDLFQGYFFCRPEVLNSTRICESKLAHYRLLQTAQAEEFNLVKVEQVIKSDVALTAKLLKYINAAAFPWADSIRSVRHSLTLMGESNVRRWISMIALTGMVADKPWELAVASTSRGRFCELVGRLVDRVHTELEHFLLGAFSTLEAMLDVPMELALRQIPISGDLRGALCGEHNILRDLLDLSDAYEQGKWSHLGRLCDRLGLEESRLPGIYHHSLTWTERVLRA